jgi:hypothetical protein
MTDHAYASQLDDPTTAQPAPAAGHWFHCGPEHVLYPDVDKCPVPGREFAPGPNAHGRLELAQTEIGATSPSPTKPTLLPLTGSPADATTRSSSESRLSAAFKQGQIDWQSWEGWFGNLTGDYRAGAEYWAAHRSAPNVKSLPIPTPFSRPIATPHWALVRAYPRHA